MKVWSCVLLLFAATGAICFPQAAPNSSPAAPQWVSHQVSGDDGEAFDELLLQGTYLKPPKNVAAQPSLIVRCENGKVIQNFFSFGAVLSQSVGGLHPVRLETQIDSYHKVIDVDDVSPDWTAAFFSRKYLYRIVHAKVVKVGAVEFAGPVIQAKFAMPDPEPVYSACGKDKSLNPTQPF
jgi:hypothetical protein